MVLKGNHDRMFSGFLSDPNDHDPGLRRDLSAGCTPGSAARQTLASYGVADAADRPLAPVHAEAVAAVPAGPPPLSRQPCPPATCAARRSSSMPASAPASPSDDQTETDLVWIREPASWTTPATMAR